jgi:hypothetical protein
MEQSIQTDLPEIPKTNPKEGRVDGFHELVKDIYNKLDSIQAVIGYILEKTNLNKISADSITPENALQSGESPQQTVLESSE